MCEASIYEAKTQFSKYVSLIESGEEEEIVILKNGQKVAKLIKYHEENVPVRLGAGLAHHLAKPFVMDDESDKLGDLFGY